MEQIISKIKTSVFVNFEETRLSEILIPQLVDCKTICIANKQEADSIYFSRIRIDQFIFFLERFGYPRHMTEHIKNNKDELDHLLFDVGFDYKTKDGRLIIIKSGYYGTF